MPIVSTKPNVNDSLLISSSLIDDNKVIFYPPQLRKIIPPPPFFLSFFLLSCNFFARILFLSPLSPLNSLCTENSRSNVIDMFHTHFHTVHTVYLYLCFTYYFHEKKKNSRWPCKVIFYYDLIVGSNQIILFTIIYTYLYNSNTIK